MRFKPTHYLDDGTDEECEILHASGKFAAIRYAEGLVAVVSKRLLKPLPKVKRKRTGANS